MASSFVRLIAVCLLFICRQVLAQQLPGINFNAVNSGISDACAGALNTTVDCDPVLAKAARTRGFLTASQLGSLCTSNCLSSLQDTKNLIQGVCNLTTDVMTVSNAEYPATWNADNFIFAFNSSCLKEPSTGDFCNTAIQSWANNSEKADDYRCSECMLSIMAMQLSSPIGYSNESAESFESVTASCSASGYTYTAPTSYSTRPTSPIAANTSTTNMSAGATPSCVAQYEIQEGDTCTSIALSQNVSTFMLTYTNNIDAYCASMPSTGTKLCLPESCKVYSVKEGQSCMDVVKEVADRITVTQLHTWNPNINRMCGNLQRMNGTIICVSPPGGYLLDSNSTGGDPEAEKPVPVPSNIGNGTSTECGQYYTVQKGDFCAALSVRFDISLDQLYSLNSGLERGNCTNLEAGKAYCVQPVAGADAASTASMSGLECLAPSAPSSCFGDTSTLTDVPKIAGNWSMFPMPMISTSLKASTLSNAPVSSPVTTGTAPMPTVMPSTAPASATSSAEPSTSSVLTAPLSTQPSSTSGNATSTSSAPTQSGVTSDCSEFYTIQEGDTCATIEDAYGVTLQDLQFWNSDIGEQCENLLVGFSICVHGPPLPTFSSTVPVTSASVAPTQTSGIATDCTAFYTVQEGDSCDSIEETNSISFEQFHAWNPSIGDICEDLLVGFQYCVAGPPVPTPTSAPPPSSVSVAPTQTSGITDSCSEYYTIQEDDSCDSIEQDHGISFEQFHGWNPSIGDNCENLLVGFQYCVAAA